MESEATIRLALFLGVGAALGIGEIAAPRRPPDPGRTRRWFGNLGVVAIAAVVIRLLFPILPVTLALVTREQEAGLLPGIGLPYVLEVIAGFLVLDLAIYAQHRAFHSWRPLWRLHRMHHADTFFDFTTGVRFHPLEFIISMGFKLLVIAVVAPPALAVLLFEIGLNCIVMFNHANLRVPEQLDRALRLIVVTPDMHRVHHSTDPRETSRNFGFNSPWWDYLFATYVAQPRLGHHNMRIGLNIFRDAKYWSLPRLLAMPFL